MSFFIPEMVDSNDTKGKPYWCFGSRSQFLYNDSVHFKKLLKLIMTLLDD